jgi:hypothetical protein
MRGVDVPMLTGMKSDLFLDPITKNYAMILGNKSDC